MAQTKIYTETKRIIEDYQTRPISIMDGLLFNQYKIIKMCEFYANSKYLQGNLDELQREKPFYNIVNYRVTLAKTATDLDIKDIQISSDNPKHTVQAMLLQNEAYEWMKETGFDYFLNKKGLTRPKYGGVLVKKTMAKDNEDKDQLQLDVVDWRNVVTDQIDIPEGAIIERHYMTPVQLMEKDDTWDNVREAIIASKKQKGKTAKYAFNGDEHNTDRILVYEVTGMFTKEIYNDFNDEEVTEDDQFEYSLQHYFIADVNGKGISLYSEEWKEDDFQYMYLPWEEMPGRALGRGVIEDCEEAQVWTNDAVINEKNAMDIAGKVLLKTDSKSVGSNILEIDNGRIFELEMGKQLDKLELAPASIGEYNEQIQRWNDVTDKNVSSYDASTGKQPPADTPYSQTALLNQVAAKPFDYRREEDGIFTKNIFEKWVIPYLIKKLYKEHMLVTDFTSEELEVIDDAFATYQVNEHLKNAILSGKIVSADQYQESINDYKKVLQGSRRFMQIPEGFFDDIDAKVTVITTGEQKNKAAILQSLSTILGDVQQSYNPQTGKFAILEDPVMARIFGTILELSGSGITAASLGIGKPQSNSNTQSPQGQPQAPMQQPQGQNPQAQSQAVPSSMTSQASQQPTAQMQ